MDVRFNEWKNLKWVDPAKVLLELRKIQDEVARSNLPNKVKNLRTHKLRKHHERWIVALFCYGMSKIIGNPVYVASYASSDYDAVALRKENDILHYTPIQIKEVVPPSINTNTDIEAEIARLRKRGSGVRSLFLTIWSPSIKTKSRVTSLESRVQSPGSKKQDRGTRFEV